MFQNILIESSFIYGFVFAVMQGAEDNGLVFEGGDDLTLVFKFTPQLAIEFHIK